jgi:single-strand DNA-binding protein
MSRTLNKVMLIGNVGKDPELKYTPSGIPVTSFRLATSETWKDREGNIQEHTDWHTIVAWRGLAEVIHKLVGKGSRVYIEGRIQTRNFDDKSGSRRHVVEVLADNMLLLDPRKSNRDYEDDSSYEDDYEIDDDFSNSVSSKSNDFPF